MNLIGQYYTLIINFQHCKAFTFIKKVRTSKWDGRYKVVYMDISISRGVFLWAVLQSCSNFCNKKYSCLSKKIRKQDDLVEETKSGMEKITLFNVAVII